MAGADSIDRVVKNFCEHYGGKLWESKAAAIYHRLQWHDLVVATLCVVVETCRDLFCLSDHVVA